MYTIHTFTCHQTRQTFTRLNHARLSLDLIEHTRQTLTRPYSTRQTFTRPYHTRQTFTRPNRTRHWSFELTLLHMFHFNGLYSDYINLPIDLSIDCFVFTNRLPILQGVSASFLVPIITILKQPKWKCPYTEARNTCEIFRYCKNKNCLYKML